jgi:hypothetical protein
MKFKTVEPCYELQRRANLMNFMSRANGKYTGSIPQRNIQTWNVSTDLVPTDLTHESPCSCCLGPCVCRFSHVRMEQTGKSGRLFSLSVHHKIQCSSGPSNFDIRFKCRSRLLNLAIRFESVQDSRNSMQVPMLQAKVVDHKLCCIAGNVRALISCLEQGLVASELLQIRGS